MGSGWGRRRREGRSHRQRDVVCLHSSVSCIGILSLSDCSAEPSGFSTLSGKQATPAPGSDTASEAGSDTGGGLLLPVSP